MRPAAAVTAEARLCGPSVQFLRWPSLNRPGCFLPRADIQTDAPANRRTGKQTHRRGECQVAAPGIERRSDLGHPSALSHYRCTYIGGVNAELCNALHQQP